MIHLEQYFDKFLMLLLMLLITVFIPFLYVGFVIKWAYIDAKDSSKFFYSRINKLYKTAYLEFIK